MAFDYKKEYREYYLPKDQPQIVDIPQMNFLSVSGSGDPNEEGGDYQEGISLLYGLAYTIRMSKKSAHNIEGFFDYVVPPLEGFWYQEGVKGVDYLHKEMFQWNSVIRLPDFVKEEDYVWALLEAEKKKKKDFSPVKFLSLKEGLCVQCLHKGSYDSEPETVAKMDAFLRENGFENDFSASRLHHEIYLSDPRKTSADNLRTVIRHPIRKRD